MTNIEHFAPHIAAHYNHAREKHPYFADEITPLPLEQVAAALGHARQTLDRQIVEKRVSVTDILDCEIAEAYEEYQLGNTAAAVEECYDAIAVLLRMIDVLEGRQALGNPTKKGEME